MGFKPKRKLYKLTWAADTDYDGMEVTMTSIPTGTILELEELTTRSDAAKADSGTFRRLLEVLGSAMLSWNVETDDGEPIPAGQEGLKTQDADLIMAIIAAWTSAMSGVPAPLDGRSTSGGSFPEANLPMAPLSPNLSS
jgi:hypothetical protein